MHQLYLACTMWKRKSPSNDVVGREYFDIHHIRPLRVPCFGILSTTLAPIVSEIQSLYTQTPLVFCSANSRDLLDDYAQCALGKSDLVKASR